MTHKLYNILSIILLTIAICSCGSSKKAQRQAQVVEAVNESKSSNVSSLIKEYLNTETSSSSDDLQILITEYDTTQAADTLTGLPPVKKEIKVNRRKDTKQESRKEQTDSLASRTDVSSHTHIQDSVYTEAVREHAETTVPKQIGNAVWAVCALVALFIVLYFVRRFVKR